jgi:ABC-type cobalamin/Fe3+-siderophores transport system ATPase subunit
MPLADRSSFPAVLVVTGIMAAGKSTIAQALDALRPSNPGAVVLCPSPGAAARRDAARAKTGYVSWTAEELDRALRAETPRLGLWLDTSSLGVEETVEAILGEAGRMRAGIGA